MKGGPLWKQVRQIQRLGTLNKNILSSDSYLYAVSVRAIYLKSLNIVDIRINIRRTLETIRLGTK